jgi:hypothetical protein
MRAQSGVHVRVRYRWAIGLLGTAAMIVVPLQLGSSAGAEHAVSEPRQARGVAAQVAVLRRPVVQADAMPERWRRQIEVAHSEMPADLGAPGLDAARRVSTPIGVSLWLMPRDSDICVLEAAGDAAGFGCYDASAVLAGRAYATSTGVGYGLSENEVRVSGLMPDGVPHVTLRMRDGSAQSVAIRQNIYSAVLQAQVAQLEWRDASGEEHVVSIPRTVM